MANGKVSRCTLIRESKLLDFSKLQNRSLSAPGRKFGDVFCSAGFQAPCLQTCCIADFPVGRPSFVMALADLEIRDTAGLETCATSSYLRPPALSSHDRDQVANFFVHFTVRGDGLCDLFPEQSTEMLTQPMNGYIEGSNTDALAGGQLRSRWALLRSGQEAVHLLEPCALAPVRIFLSESSQGLFQHAQRPALLKESLGREL